MYLLQMAHQLLVDQVNYLQKRVESMRKTIKDQIEIIGIHRAKIRDQNKALQEQDEIIRAQIAQINDMQERLAGLGKATTADKPAPDCQFDPTESEGYTPFTIALYRLDT